MQEEVKAVDATKEAKPKKVKDTPAPIERAGAKSAARPGRTGPMISITLPVARAKVSAEVEAPTAQFLEDYRNYLKAHTGVEVTQAQVLDGIAKFVASKDKSFRVWREETRG